MANESFKETNETKEGLSHYKFGILDPRPIPEAEAANAKLLGPNTLGIEVTEPKLAKECGLGNIDPQHTEGKKNLAAIEVALNYPLPPDNARLVTIRPDLDAFGSMAVLALRKDGKNITPDIREQIKLIADSDNFNRGDWPGTRPLPTSEKLYDDSLAGAGENSHLAPVAQAVSDFKISVDQRVSWMKEWFENGKEPAGYREHWLNERKEIANAITNGEINIEVDKNHTLAKVVSKHSAAMSLGYSMAPVVIAFNPEFKTGQEEPYKKFTIAQFKEGYINLDAIKNELNKLEPGWGGTRTILASPQGRSSKLTMEEVENIVVLNTSRKL